ncbi:uncharacterized protein B0H18DRAFT_961089 [Fomitopsis serialis]|uniref:uncharacterized protein n=1 Tax=Fomitopsis serialis TaxID=139415 RepID=UPI002008B11B|nr:uncharacterized protein B0H18DRAFT_961089 [Neoantrodia serialis]KAH9912423.1 hypothetical protein B0H18DRAFT_961089 [Neoantrodia serialis]
MSTQRPGTLAISKETVMLGSPSMGEPNPAILHRKQAWDRASRGRIDRAGLPQHGRAQHKCSAPGTGARPGPADVVGGGSLGRKNSTQRVHMCAEKHGNNWDGLSQAWESLSQSPPCSAHGTRMTWEIKDGCLGGSQRWPAAWVEFCQPSWTKPSCKHTVMVALGSPSMGESVATTTVRDTYGRGERVRDGRIEVEEVDVGLSWQNTAQQLRAGKHLRGNVHAQLSHAGRVVSRARDGRVEVHVLGRTLGVQIVPQGLSPAGRSTGNIDARLSHHGRVVRVSLCGARLAVAGRAGGGQITTQGHQMAADSCATVRA